MSKKFGSLVLIVIVITLLMVGYRYIHFRTVNAVSDAAFIKSDRLAILSFKVGGKVIEMDREENRQVHKGELLARIDPKDLKVAQERAEHLIQALKEQIGAMQLKKERLAKTLKTQKDIASLNISSVHKQSSALAFRIDASRTRLQKLKKDRQRYENMLQKRLIAKSEYESIATEQKALADTIEAMKSELEGLGVKAQQAFKAQRLAQINLRQIAELDRSIKAQKQKLKAQMRYLEDLHNKIGYTRLYAPFDGIVAKKFFDAPKVLKKGSPVYAVTDPKALYCKVLLSEKKMKGVRPGNRVEITVDALEGKKFEGTVESIAPTSASTFSLVPRDIASGEFTKLDQRFNVRIKLKKSEGLRAGMSASVAIARR